MSFQRDVAAKVATSPTTRPALTDDHNPFSTSCVRPGAIDYLFEEGQSIERLVETLRANGWRGAIVGPHGTGKSTLLRNMIAVLENSGRRIVQIDPRSEPSAAEADFASIDGNALLVVDGYQQLGWRRRLRLRQICRRRGAGMLATAHRPIGLPTLWQTSASLEQARRIVTRLLPADDATITDDDIAACFRARQGNMRETLFALYDIYQQRRGQSRGFQ